MTMNPYLFLAAAAQTETHHDRIQFHHHFVARSESDGLVIGRADFPRQSQFKIVRFIACSNVPVEMASLLGCHNFVTVGIMYIAMCMRIFTHVQSSRYNVLVCNTSISRMTENIQALNKDSEFRNIKGRRTQISDERRLSLKHSSEFFSSLIIVNHAVQYEGHRFIHRKLIGDILHIFLFQCLYEFLRIFILLYCNRPSSLPALLA